MNSYIKDSDTGIEVGCGMGAGKNLIKAKSFLLTDKAEYDWLDIKNVEATATPFENESLDFVVANNMIHHLAHPLKFFKEMNRILKPGGKILIQDINTSFFMRLILQLMKHEGYSFKPDVFDETIVCNNPDDLWSANCAIPQLLFGNSRKFEKNISNFKIIRKKFTEFIIFLNSGGVTAKTFYVPLPLLILVVLKKIDDLLALLFPSIFALQMQIVLQKSPHKS